MPLLEFAQFGALLQAAASLAIVQLSKQEISELNEFRKRAAHGAIDAVIYDRSDCGRLTLALKIARTAAQAAARRSLR
jgi:L-alanine-DL-glutamate epimerase-like enolase superfamily enzyme